MSSKSTLGQIQGTAAMTRKVRTTVVENRKAILVQIGWTNANVIKTTVRKNFKISVLAMDTKNWTVIQRSMMTLREGQVIHYTQSSEHPGYYYITIVGESCTCMAGLYKQPCHHQENAETFEISRQLRQLCKTAPVTPKMSAEEANDFFLSLGKAEDARREFQAKVQAWEKMQADESARYVIEKEAREVEAYEKRVAWLAEQKKQVA